MTDERMRIPPKNAAACELCGNLLNVTKPGVHQWTSGWVKNRQGGGGHGISCAEREARWAHDECVRKRADRFENQGSLFA